VEIAPVSALPLGSEPDISVVIPAYNRAGLLPFTLDAILAQTPPPREVIVVDDGSRDETPAVLARYPAPVRTIRIENSGDLVARNNGLRAASGELVAFCDSDDLWRPGFLAAMGELWRVEPETKVAFCDFVAVRGEEWAAESKFSTAPEGFWDGLRRVGPGLGVFDQPVAGRVLRFQPFFPSCMAARRDFLLQAGGWDEAVSRIVGCDFATILRVAEYTPFGVIERELVGIRRHAGNFSADVQAMNLGDSRVLEHVLLTRPAMAPHAAAIRASIGQRRRDALDTAFARRDLAAVRDIDTLLTPDQRSSATRLKRLVSGLPGPLGVGAAEALLAFGSAVARIRGG
jgi:glycosyltransferase involved in cell wall biosynthesis